MAYKIIIYIFFGITPALMWLFYYLRKDPHPEPQKMILRIFLWGALITLPVFFIQIGLMSLLSDFQTSKLVYDLIYWFFIISFSEELFKYLVVKFKVINSPHFDEPVDIMIYMVIAALGFAALENILYLFAPAGQIPFNTDLNRALIIGIIRFLGATFLHTLCSAVTGYFMAISFCKIKRGIWVVPMGLILATFLHGLYDFSIMTLTGYLRLVAPLSILIILGSVIFEAFRRTEKMKSICVIKPEPKTKEALNIQ